MLSHQPKYNKDLDNFHIKANDDQIDNKRTIQILGFILKYNLDLDTQIGTLCANLHHRI